MTTSRSTLLRALGVAHVAVAIMLLPANLFLGFFTIMIVLPAQFWLFSLGVRLWRPDARLQAALRTTHLLFAPFALLLIVYGAYALGSPVHSKASGGGLLGSFGLLPIVLGTCSGLLALWSLFVATYGQFAPAQGEARPPDLIHHPPPQQFPTQVDSGKTPPAYVETFMTVVADENKPLYLAQAQAAAAVFKAHGALRIVECWGEDRQELAATSLPRAPRCRAGETLVFSSLTWPSKDVRDAGMKAIMADSRLAGPDAPFPFADRQLIYSGATLLVED